MHLGPIFASFLGTEDTSGIVDASAIEQELQLQKQNGTGFLLEGGWQSNFLDLNSAALKPLVDLVTDRAYNISHSALDVKHDVNVTLKEHWANINYTDTPYQLHSNPPHLHAHNFISFVYYARAEEGCGNLSISTPIAVQEYTLPTYYTSGGLNEFSSHRVHITPQTGMLVAFNSYLMHYVAPNLSGHDRISIAFNFALPHQPSIEND